MTFCCFGHDYPHDHSCKDLKDAATGHILHTSSSTLYVELSNVINTQRIILWLE